MSKNKTPLSRLVRAVRSVARNMGISGAQEAAADLKNSTSPVARLLRAAALKSVTEHDVEIDAITDDMEAIADMESE